MNTNLKKLLVLLNDGKPHSGVDLGKYLNLTRAAIWKLIKQIEALDIEIEAKTNYGYKLARNLEFLDKSKIGKYLARIHKKYLDKIIIFEELPSTNPYLSELVKTNPKCDKYICLAESQTSGRGRLGRQWISPYARNIYLSLLWRFVKTPGELGGLSLAVAVAVAEALKRYGIHENIQLKWPNDVLWQQKKLAGILIEVSGEAHHAYNAVIGIGINVDMPAKLDQKIGQDWCDIAQITNSIPQRNKLIGLLLDQLLITMDVYQKSGLKPFLDKWSELDISVGKQITLITPQEKVIGIASGIDEQGHFLLKDKLGKIHSFAAGEVSLAKNKANR